ncbi:MAG: hypothetical protein RMJ89_00860, partial [Flammeovirgaceae bacterium]|nr:hypothetical protein [Flammeovirgaceae bacterium]
EMVMTLEDFYERRTGRLYFNPESVTKYLEPILNDFAEFFDWDEEKIDQEREKILKKVKALTTFEYSVKQNV